MTLALTIEARDPTTSGHCERLARHAVALGRALAVGEKDLQALHRGGYLHDVGKVGVPDAVLLKKGPLTAGEFELMKKHPDIGDSLCAPAAVAAHRAANHPVPSRAARRQRVSAGLRGDEVPLLAQIVGICDVFDALTSHRPYRPALSAEEAARHLLKEAAQGNSSASTSRRSSASLAWGRSRRCRAHVDEHIRSRPAARRGCRCGAASADRVPVALAHGT
jgi:putative two-component system response regulator